MTSPRLMVVSESVTAFYSLGPTSGWWLTAHIDRGEVVVVTGESCEVPGVGARLFRVISPRLGPLWIPHSHRHERLEEVK